MFLKLLDLLFVHEDRSKNGARSVFKKTIGSAFRPRGPFEKWSYVIYLKNYWLVAPSMRSSAIDC